MKTLRRAILIGGSVIGAALLVVSVSYACSPSGHDGFVWFCSGTSCGINDRAGKTSGTALAADTTYYTNASGLDLGSGTTYTVKWVNTQDAADDCKNSMGDLGTVAASGSAGSGNWTGHQVSSTIFSGSPGAYTLCATAGTGEYDAASVELYFWSY